MSTESSVALSQKLPVYTTTTLLLQPLFWPAEENTTSVKCLICILRTINANYTPAQPDFSGLKVVVLMRFH